MPWPDLNNDGIVNLIDLELFQEQISEGGITPEEQSQYDEMYDMVLNDTWTPPTPPLSEGVSQQNAPLGISAPTVGNIGELQGMLKSYQERKSLIQAPQRQKAIFTIDRFDGGINLNKSPRDLSYWEACQMDCLSPSKIGRLIRLGDFSAKISASSGNGLEGFVSDDTAIIENYGLHYFKLSDSVAANESFAGETSTNYIAIQDGDDIDIWNLGNSAGDNDTTTPNLITSLNTSANPVYHDASNRVYVSDASFLSSKTYMFGIVDRRKLFPFDSSGTLTYNITGDSHLLGGTEGEQPLYHAAPTKGNGDGEIMVTGTQSDSIQMATLTNVMDTAASGTTTQHNGIYLNINFEDITAADDIIGTGWGGSAANQAKYYKFFASFLYDDGSETKLTDVTNSEFIVTQANRDFSASSDWANAAGVNAFNAYDETTGGVLTVTPDDDGSNRQYATLDGAFFETGMVVGKTYRLSYTLTVSSFTGGTLSIGTANDAYALQDVNNHTATFSQATETLDFTYDADCDKIIINAAVSTVLTAVFDNFSLKEIPSAGVAPGNTAKATTGSQGEYQKLVVKQCIIDASNHATGSSATSGIVSSKPRVHGARFYYTETDSSGNAKGDDKYQWAELDFRYGFKLLSEFGNWNQFDNDTADDANRQYIQVLNAANEDDDISAGGTLSIETPPRAFTYYALNLFHQEELKDDLMWKTSTVGNGIAFIGNIKYDGREYTDTMLYSGAGETDSGSAYPMWGTFPVDSNRIDIPGGSGEITALKWTNNKVLQFRKNAMYLIDVADVLAPKVEGVYQGMGVHGQWAVTETSFGCAWVNDNGVYAYNLPSSKQFAGQGGVVTSLTMGRLDTEDFQLSKEDTDKTKIGYDDRAKMLIITNTTNYDTNGYHYAYSFITDSWCTWNANKAHASNVKTNLAIDHDGYLTGAVDSGTTLNVYKWSAVAQAAQTVDYITKDIDLGKPNLDKRFYTLYISYTGGDGQSGLNVYFRVNGKEGSDLSNGWYQLETIQDYTDPYFTTAGSAWADSSGTPVTGDPTINIDTGLNSTSTGEVQKLAKINLRNLGSTDTVDITDTSVSTFPADYFKFARSIQFRITGTADENFEINDISLVFKEKRLK